MALPSTTAEAIRDVMLSLKYGQSTTIEDFDTEDPGRLHKQFFLKGPRLVGTLDVSQETHQEWEMDIQFAYAPVVQGDPDRRRFDLADAVATIHSTLATNATILSDEFEMSSSDPEWNPDTDVWEVMMQVRFLTYQAVSA